MVTTAFPYSLYNIACVSNGKTRSISAENPNGEKGGGARAVPEENSLASILGKGWKVRPYIALPGARGKAPI